MIHLHEFDFSVGRTLLPVDKPDRRFIILHRHPLSPIDCKKYGGGLSIAANQEVYGSLVFYLPLKQATCREC